LQYEILPLRIANLDRRHRLIEAGVKRLVLPVERLQSMAPEDVQELCAHQLNAFQQGLKIRLLRRGLQRTIEVIQDRQEIGQQLTRGELDTLL
jgi:hypothetical protein